MKEFSHPGSEEKVSLDINSALESVMNVSRNEWKYSAELVLKLDQDGVSAMCFPGEINQTFLNFIVNSAQAIDSVKQQDSDRQVKLR